MSRGISSPEEVEETWKTPRREALGSNGEFHFRKEIGWSAVFVIVTWRGREYFEEEEDCFWSWILFVEEEEEEGEMVMSRSEEGWAVILEGPLGKR